MSQHPQIDDLLREARATARCLELSLRQALQAAGKLEDPLTSTALHITLSGHVESVTTIERQLSRMLEDIPAELKEDAGIDTTGIPVIQPRRVTL
jgi:hypothetical protein